MDRGNSARRLFDWFRGMHGHGNHRGRWFEDEIRVEERPTERARRHVYAIARWRFAARELEGQSRAGEFLGDLVRAVPHRDSVDDWLPAKICEPGIYNPGRGDGR